MRWDAGLEAAEEDEKEKEEGESCAAKGKVLNAVTVPCTAEPGLEETRERQVVLMSSPSKRAVAAPLPARRGVAVSPQPGAADVAKYVKE